MYLLIIRVYIYICIYVYIYIYISKGLPQQAEVAQGVPGRFLPRNFLTFRHYKGGRSSAKCTSQTPGEIPGTHFQRLSPPQGTCFCQGGPRKSPQ